MFLKISIHIPGTWNALCLCKLHTSMKKCTRQEVLFLSLSHTLFHAQFPGNKEGGRSLVAGFGDVAILRSHFWMKMAIGMAPAIYGSKSGTPLGHQIFISGQFFGSGSSHFATTGLVLSGHLSVQIPFFFCLRMIIQSFQKGFVIY